MKISYRYEKNDKKQKKALTGVRRANESSVKKRNPKQKKKPNIKRAILLSVLLFLVETLIFYLSGNSLVKNSIDYLINPEGAIPKFKYETISIELSSNLSEELRSEVTNSISDIAYEETKRFNITSENPDIKLEYKKEKSDSDFVIAEQYIVPVGHLYWIKDGVTTDGIRENGVLVPAEYEDMIRKLIPSSWGEIEITATDTVLADLKKSEARIALVPISTLDGQYKVQKLDNKLFFNNTDGALKYYLVLSGKNNIGKTIVNTRADAYFPNSFDNEQLLSVRMTGVTAITRSLGMKTDESGDNAYAARKIGDFLSKADLTHVSNEISFLSGCSYTGGVSFCTKPAHIAALKKSGVDIVELTGNHNNDKGSTANKNSINTYKDLGWDYFGGGLNNTDAAKILYKDLKGTKVAFIGYNYYDTIYGTGAIANASHAGANSWSKTKVTNNVAEAKKNADVVIVTFQYQECWAYTDDYSTNPACYAPIPSPNQKSDFRYAVDAGADIVIGTQAHQPQTYEIYKGKVIYYGLGNLYFDQTYWLGTRQGMVLTHYMYEGQYLGTDITTTIYDNDMLTYITTGSKRTTLLKSLKNAR